MCSSDRVETEVGYDDEKDYIEHASNDMQPSESFDIVFFFSPSENLEHGEHSPKYQECQRDGEQRFD